MLSSAVSDEFGAPCSNGENIILFLTDGQPTSGASTYDALKTIIDSYGIDVTILSYAFGTQTEKTIL